MACEIQVRTILQDAWAIVAHHLSYKQETDVPKVLRRKLHALSGLFETADDQFEGLKDSIGTYTEKVEKELASSTEVSLAEDINLDNLMAYLSTKFPDRKSSSREVSSELLHELKTHGYNNLSSVEKMIDTMHEAVLADENDHPPTDSNDNKTLFAGVGLVRSALAFANKEYCINKYNTDFLDRKRQYNHLINKDA